MNIISAKSWGMKIKSPLKPLNLKKVNALALHHMSHPNADIYEVERWHLNQGWRAFGYNFWVGFDGKIYEGRGFNIGAGVENQNDKIISIGFQGDYHSNPIKMPNSQFNAGVDIIKWVLDKVPNIKSIGGHKHYMATACPGKYFPLEEIKKLNKREELISYANAIAYWVANKVIVNPEKWYKGIQDAVDCEWLCRKTATYAKTGGLNNIMSFSKAIHFWQSNGVIISPSIWYKGEQTASDGEWLCRKTVQYHIQNTKLK